ncbi:MAG: response regulator transcription factor [Nitriliruptoraceae bacterium]
MARVLAVDDEAQILTALARSLNRVGYEVTVARTGEDALAATAAGQPDLILLDLRLPDLDGIEVVRRLRAWTQVPILLLSGEGTERSRVTALDAGADDFIDKPFSMEELRARVGAALRRSGTGDDDAPADPRIVTGEVIIDLTSRQLLVAGEPVRLTPTEWRLLELLCTHPGQLLTYDRIIEAVWSSRHGQEARDSLRVHLRSLRRKLGDDAGHPRFVRTEPGIGYRWVAGDGS